MTRSLEHRRLQILLLAVGCVILAGLPVPGGLVSSLRSSLAFGRGCIPPRGVASGSHAPGCGGLTAPDENAALAAAPTGAAAPMGVPLPACRIGGGDAARAGREPDGQQARDDTLAPRAVTIETMSRLPVRYTLGGAMTQTLVLADAGERPGRDVQSDSPAAREGRPRALVPLYISMTALQLLDIVSTERVLGAGGIEANPLVAPLVGSTPKFVALKAGVSGAMIYAVERLWKQNRKAAILMLMGANIGYAAVVSHNFAQAAGASGTR